MSTINRMVISKYDNLKGVDFSSSPSLVDRNRSPYCLNIMPDDSTKPVKRPGWETVYSLDGEVFNIWFCTLNGKKYMLCHCGDKIYSVYENNKVIKSGVAKGKGCGFYALKGDKGGFYILTTEQFLFFDGEKIQNVSDVAYIPLVTIAKTPKGGGESYENINLLSPKRRENFIGTQEDLVYQLGTDNIENIDKIEVLNEDGSHRLLNLNIDYTFDKALGKITFVKQHPTLITGQDNIFVTYTKTIAGYKEKIEKCTISTMFGLGGENRVFLSGNPLCPQKDFWSGVFDPSYFSDLDYSVIGSGQTAVMGYLKLGEYLGIVKEGNGQDTSLFLRRATMNDGKALFTVQGGISGIGAISKNCFALLNDEPLFLSSRGVFAVSNSVITSEKIIVNRSYQVDAKLTAENNLKDAVACLWKGFYILSVNGNCYVLDSRQIVAAKSGEKNSRYEAYFWNNVYANCFAVEGDVLWFGTKDGKIRRFKDEKIGYQCYSDDGQPIHAIWKTPVEDEGFIERFKTLQRKGCLVVLAPYVYSSCKIYYGVDGAKDKFIKQSNIDISTLFEEVNFSRLGFNSNTGPREVYFNSRQCRYKRIQFIFENNEINEGFGIHKVVKSFVIKEHSKNRR